MKIQNIDTKYRCKIQMQNTDAKYRINLNFRPLLTSLPTLSDGHNVLPLLIF